MFWIKIAFRLPTGQLDVSIDHYPNFSPRQFSCCVEISGSFLITYLRNEPSKSVLAPGRIGLGQAGSVRVVSGDGLDRAGLVSHGFRLCGQKKTIYVPYLMPRKSTFSRYRIAGKTCIWLWYEALDYKLASLRVACNDPHVKYSTLIPTLQIHTSFKALMEYLP